MNHNNLWLSIGSSVMSGISYLVAFVTDLHIMALLGFISLVVSIWAAVLTVVERRMNIRRMREEEEEKGMHHKGRSRL